MRSTASDAGHGVGCGARRPADCRPYGCGGPRDEEPVPYGCRGRSVCVRSTAAEGPAALRVRGTVGVRAEHGGRGSGRPTSAGGGGDNLN